jgi:TP901 family phage tail tape measure protein
LRYELKELATQIPLSFTELAKIMELGGQLGVKKDNLTKFTEVVAKL